ncbi:MAG: aspartate-semialdehyde dehydrogenase [Phycisphaerales bacterium]|nr:aspartate-semialdehyde dehydrogenase [Phycisphaerales bacterium]
MHDRRITVIGATGAVGREALAILAAAGHPASHVRAVASDRSIGAECAYGDDVITLDALDHDVASECDLALCCAGADVSRTWTPRFLAAGAAVVDNSSCFRADPDVPLVIPEVNGDVLDRSPRPRVVANPNCSTTLLLLAVDPLRRAFGVERIVVSTYQAVSGAGQAGIDEWRAQMRDVAAGRPPSPRTFPEPCVGNVFTHESTLDPTTGFTGEESKMIHEARRIWTDPHLALSPTCVRVPVERAHSQAVTVTLRTPTTVADARAALRHAPGLRLEDDARPPTPLRATGRDEVLVGRVRAAVPDEVDERGRTHTLSLWLSGDQLRKGAALNALQIAARMHDVARR